MIRKVTDQRLPSAPRKIAEGERARELRHKGFCPYPLAETADGETGKDADPQSLAYHAQDQSVIVRVHRRQVGKVPRIEKRRDARVRRHDEGERGECGLAGIFYGVNIAGTGACIKKLNATLYLLIQSSISMLFSLITALVLNRVPVTDAAGNMTVAEPPIPLP